MWSVQHSATWKNAEVVSTWWNELREDDCLVYLDCSQSCIHETPTSEHLPFSNLELIERAWTLLLEANWSFQQKQEKLNSRNLSRNTLPSKVRGQDLKSNVQRMSLKHLHQACRTLKKEKLGPSLAPLIQNIEKLYKSLKKLNNSNIKLEPNRRNEGRAHKAKTLKNTEKIIYSSLLGDSMTPIAA